MKAYQYISIVAAAVVILFASCQKMAYEGEFSKDGFYHGNNKIYFHFDQQSDTLQRYSFGTEWVEHTRQVVKVPVRIAGFPSDKPMTFKVSVDEKNSTAVANKHYTAFSGEFVIPADSVNGYVEIEVWRDNLSIEKKDEAQLVLLLEKTADLEPAFPESNRVIVSVDDYLEEPYFWIYYAYYWGPYSRVKYLKFLEYYDRDPKKLEDALMRGDFTGVSMNFLKVYEFFKAHPEYGVELPDNPYYPFQ